VEYVLMQLADPLLRPIRNLLPSMGGIDFSPMVPYSTGLRPWLTQLMIAISSSTQKISEPMVFSRIRIIPAMGPIDSASLLVAFILCVIKAIVLFMVITFNRLRGLYHKLRKRVVKVAARPLHPDA
jgi:uncharacterized protein YggT (Ycf19 family)